MLCGIMKAEDWAEIIGAAIPAILFFGFIGVLLLAALRILGWF
jgi:hypothetical protein